MFLSCPSYVFSHISSTPLPYLLCFYHPLSVALVLPTYAVNAHSSYQNRHTCLIQSVYPTLPVCQSIYLSVNLSVCAAVDMSSGGGGVCTCLVIPVRTN